MRTLNVVTAALRHVRAAVRVILNIGLEADHIHRAKGEHHVLVNTGTTWHTVTYQPYLLSDYIPFVVVG